MVHIFHCYQLHIHHSNLYNVHLLNLRSYTKDRILNKALYCWKMNHLNMINTMIQYCPIRNKVNWHWLKELILCMYALVTVHNPSNNFYTFQLLNRIICMIHRFVDRHLGSWNMNQKRISYKHLHTTQHKENP